MLEIKKSGRTQTVSEKELHGVSAALSKKNKEAYGVLSK